MCWPWIDDSPRVLGIALIPSRLLLLGGAVLLTAGAVSTVGVVAFVGLVAPHAARSLVGAPYFMYLLWRSRAPKR